MKNIVFESPSKWHKWVIKYYLMRGDKVWVIEPFHTYHHEKGIRFFPPPWPDYICRLVEKKKISIITVSSINAKEIYFLAADKAVKTVEYVYSGYQKKHRLIIEYICKSINSSLAETIFKKSLCDRLAVFYSVNIMLHRIEETISNKKIIFFPEMNILFYTHIKNLLIKSGQELFMNSSIKFPLIIYLNSTLKACYVNLKSQARLFAITTISAIFSFIHTTNQKNKKQYRYGIAVVSPRQLRNNQRRADFLIDGNKIHDEETLFFPLINIDSFQKKQLHDLKGDVIFMPNKKRCVSNFRDWIKLLMLSLFEKFMRNSDEINESCRAIIEYCKWKEILKKVEIKHFISHCDFGTMHIIRNIALNQARIKTWYFIDSINNGGNYVCKQNNSEGLHPFWTYLNYEYFVAWTKLISLYYSKHPGFNCSVAVVGSLWSDHIIKIPAKDDRINDKYSIAVFDSTYSCKGFTSYQEGIIFAEHILRLVLDFPEIFVLFKEKKDRNIHKFLDSFLGSRLLELYKELDLNSRIKMYSNQSDTASLISGSDIVISFPFTSITFEAISAGKKGIWHDPMGYYKDTPYGKTETTTHSYEELKSKIEVILEKNYAPVLNDPLLVDPFCDGKAIDRFRELLNE